MIRHLCYAPDIRSLCVVLLFLRCYFLTRRAWLTRFSITPSKASFSLTRPSRRLSQNSRTVEARNVCFSSSLTWAWSSASVNPSSAASVVAQSRLTNVRSSSGGDGSRRLDDRCRVAVLEVRGLFGPLWEPFPARLWERDSEFWPFELGPPMLMDGRTSFFCLDAGRISSKSTGTPRETRNRRRIRDLTQFWGWSGGGATSCDHRERERSVLKMAEEFEMGSSSDWLERAALDAGKSRSRGSSRVVSRSGKD